MPNFINPAEIKDLRQEGIDLGMECGFVAAFQEMGKSYEETMRKLKEKFNLTEEDAKEKMKHCWKQE